MKQYFKGIWKLIIHNFSRFITIVLIIALGIAFLVGLFSVSQDLKLSYNSILTDQNISELYTKSATLYSDKTIEYINNLNLENDYNILPTLEEDKEIKIYGSSYNSKVIYRDLKAKQDELLLVEGLYPTNNNEILVEQAGKFLLDLDLNQKIVMDDVEYKVVGVVQSPWYLMKESYQNDSGSNLDTIIYIDDSTLYNDNNPKKIRKYNNLYLDYTEENYFFDNGYKDYLNKYKSQLEKYNNEIKNIQKEEFRRYIRDIFVENLLENDNDKIDKYYKNEEVNFNGFIFNYDTIDEKLFNNPTINNSYNIKEKVEEEITKAENLVKEKTGEDYYNIYLTALDSNSIYQFSLYVDKIDDVALVFPLFFFIITSLVVMSTLRRLIYEERTTIGTMRALGYSKNHIIWRYLTYGLAAGILGILIGGVIGIFTLPTVVFNTYATTCHLGDFIVSFDALVGSISMLLMLFLVVGIILLTLRGPLKETPNNLLTTKPLVKGSKIFLERIGFIWKHLKFKYKSTIRNMIRYKRNLIMMLVGISGTTGLLLVGFGLKDSINDITKLEFNDILYYEAITSADDASLLTDSRIVDKYEVYYDDESFNNHSTKVIAGGSDINKYINVGVSFTGSDVAISKPLAKSLKLSVGDTISYLNRDYKITILFDNYVDNFLIIGDELSDFKANKILLNLVDMTLEEERLFQKHLLDNNLINEIIFTSSLANTFDSLMSNLNMIIIVIVLFAAALTFIVVYNLININVCERERELATLMVLGYSKTECHGYIARETFILTIIGASLGLILGKLLHMFVCFVIDSPQIYIPRFIHPLSFVLAFGLTIVFTIIVDLCFIPKYNKISMTESLKAVD